MVLEHAVITIRPGTSSEFEAALAEASMILAASPGCRSLRLHRVVETPNRYVLLVEWESLEAHTVGFRQSEAFARWRGLIGPYFESPPVVEHLDPPVVTA